MNAFGWVVAAVLAVSLVGAARGQVMPPENQTLTMDENVPPTINVTMTQTIEGNETIANVTIDEVVNDGPGWIVVHDNLFGALGGAVGFSPVDSGTNSNVTVTIYVLAATDRLTAKLHTDLGQQGAFEYPAIDVPQMVDDQPVTANFSITAENFTVKNLTEFAGDQTRLMDLNQTRTPDRSRNQTRDPTLM
ncbi:MAG TPA: hypothetical protein PLG75_05940 [Methanoculleus sp.]|nr:hypothetical protein [Methanoculleus sp.]